MEGPREDLVTSAEIGRRLGVSRQRALVLARTPGFPEPIGHVGRAPFWRWIGVEEWMTRTRPRGRRPELPSEIETRLRFIEVALGFRVTVSRGDVAGGVMAPGGDFPQPPGPWASITKRGWGSVGGAGSTIEEAVLDALRRFDERRDKELPGTELRERQWQLLRQGVRDEEGLRLDTTGEWHYARLTFPSGRSVTAKAKSPREALEQALAEAEADGA